MGEVFGFNRKHGGNRTIENVSCEHPAAHEVAALVVY